jgi:hypothetical protein
MEPYLITGEMFKKRVVDLFLRSGSTEFPTKHRDQLVVLKSVILGLEAQRHYSELEINNHIKGWLTRINGFPDWDHLTLRRRLVDEKMLIRAQDGSCYQLNLNGLIGETFDPDIEGYDFFEIIAAGKENIALKKAAYLQGKIGMRHEA